MRINHNIAALNAYRQLTINTARSSIAMERLSSGLRINRAGDDPAGLAISERMRAQIRGLAMAQRNAQDGISVIQTAEGALTETHSILQRMRELSVQSANEIMTTSDRDSLKIEMVQLQVELDRIAKTTQFNGKTLLSGEMGLKIDSSSQILKNTSVTGVISADVANAREDITSVTFTVDSAAGTITATSANANIPAQTITKTITTAYTGSINFDQLGIRLEIKDGDLTQLDTVGNNSFTLDQNTTSAKLHIGPNSTIYESLGLSIRDMSATGSVLNLTDKNIDISSNANAKLAMNNIDKAITQVNSERAKLGAWENRLEHTINSLSTAEENLTAAESRIRDADMAKEMMEYAKSNILTQISIAMLTQANQQPELILQLLK